jgi:hypothetical protein
MDAAAITLPAPARPGRGQRIAAIASVVAAAVLALSGTVALSANALRDGDGYFTWPTETFTSNGYAITMKTVDISHAPQWVFSSALLYSVRVKASSDHALFIGIARASDVERYLAGTEHDDVSGLTYNPFQVNYDHTNGHAPQQAPTKEPFWAKSTSGAGTITLDWKPQPGKWRAVLMNADGSRGITASLQLGARTSLLWWAGGALLGLGAVAAAAAAMFYRSARSAEQRAGHTRSVHP